MGKKNGKTKRVPDVERAPAFATSPSARGAVPFAVGESVDVYRLRRRGEVLYQELTDVARATVTAVRDVGALDGAPGVVVDSHGVALTFTWNGQRAAYCALTKWLAPDGTPYGEAIYVLEKHR